MLNACRHLHGDEGQEYATIKNGWAAVGVGEPASDFEIVERETSPYLYIPDIDAAGISSVIHVPEDGLVKDVSVAVLIQHTYIGDLRVTLVSPSGETAVLHDRDGGSQNDIVETYDLGSTPGLQTFVGDRIAGDWALEVTDHARWDTGQLISWGMRIAVEDATEQTLSEEVSPGLAIPDDDPAGIESVIPIEPSGSILNLSVELDIDHTWIGDLHAVLQALVGEEVQGSWRLKISDHAGADLGTLNRWGLEIVYR